MTEKVSAFKTEVFMTADEAKDVCRLGQGEKCCAFLVVGGEGFECVRGSAASHTIWKRINEGSMNAKGIGLWDNCYWKGIHTGIISEMFK